MMAKLLHLRQYDVYLQSIIHRFTLKFMNYGTNSNDSTNR